MISGEGLVIPSDVVLSRAEHGRLVGYLEAIRQYAGMAKSQRPDPGVREKLAAIEAAAEGGLELIGGDG